MAVNSDPQKAEDPGLGLRFFSNTASPEKKRRRLIFVAVYLVAGAMIQWPIYPLFAQPEPFILGLPLSMAWVIAALALGFGALLWLYRGEPQEDGDV